MVHADNFGALLVDGGGVEIVDGGVLLGLHRVAQRAAVLGELEGAQPLDFLDAFEEALAVVGAEFLVAEDGQALLQRQLEPVAAGDAVAGPVVEILVGDDPVRQAEILVGAGLAVGEDAAGVENVEALVLHGPHVEIADGNDVKAV